ncbi:MAG TPA: hypothetical protein VE779_10550, partial [Candidatus Angelobacter sp.]|nr:hypothetical protein [Candidatus Angelobacter sp.]
PGSGVRVLAPILCTGVPLFELLFITVARIRKGMPWWKGSPDHFALRLQHAGLRKASIDLLAAGLTAVLWVSGAAMARLSALPALLLLAVVLTGMAVCWRLLLSWEV